jgi:hypothetical protein
MAEVRAEIRPAKPSDAAGIVRVQTKTWLATYPNAKLGVTIEGIRTRLARRSEAQKISQWEGVVQDEAGFTQVAVASGRRRILQCHAPGARQLGWCLLCPT